MLMHLRDYIIIIKNSLPSVQQGYPKLLLRFLIVIGLFGVPWFGMLGALLKDTSSLAVDVGESVQSLPITTFFYISLRLNRPPFGYWFMRLCVV